MERVKIIKVSNFDLESVSDSIIAESVPIYYAELITAELNKEFGGDESPDFFKAVKDDYRLHTFKP